VKVYSDILTAADVLAMDELSQVGYEDFREFTPRSGYARGFELFLYGFGSRHVRRSAHAHIGDTSYNMAATWTDFGIWMARLFKIDPRAKIAWYDGVDEFLAETHRATKSYRSREEAPWLADRDLLDLAAA